MSININLGAWSSVFAVPSKIVDEGLKFSDGVKLKVLLYVLRHADDDLELEAVFYPRLDAHGNGMGKAYRRRVGDEARLVVEDFVARRAYGAYRKVNRLRNADRDKDLALPVE